MKSKAILSAVIVMGLAILVTFLAMLRYLWAHWDAHIETAGDVGDFVGALAAIIGLIAGFIGFLLMLRGPNKVALRVVA